MFKTKTLKARVAQLEAENATLQERLRNWEHRWADHEREARGLRTQVEYLVRTIRQTDDIIFSISQHTSWEAMRPRFAQLVDQMTARKVAESNRINSVVQQEIISGYRPDADLGKLQAALPSPIDGKR
jgi:chromosome segregation ATPase